MEPEMGGEGMKRFFVFVVALWFVAAVAVCNADEISPEKRKDVEQLLTLTGSLNVAKVIIKMANDQIIGAVRQSHPDVPPKTFDIIREEIQTGVSEALQGKDGLINRLVPVYAKHYTHAEIKGLIAFYKTPLGRKSIEVSPVIAQESYATGQDWGQALWPNLRSRIVQRLKMEGIDL